MRRLIEVAAFLWVCDLCGERLLVPAGEVDKTHRFHRQHVAPRLLKMLAEADCPCG